MAYDDPYHHGNLRVALLVAAGKELSEKGLDAFSLRQVAKRAGVSHSAPKHHFGDTRGLLTALSAEGYRQLISAQFAREAVANPEPAAQLLAAGLGYVDFALQNPALFKLMFISEIRNSTDSALLLACSVAHQHMLDQVSAIGGKPDDVAAIWASVHGIAALLISGRIQHLQCMTDTERDKRLLQIFSKAISIVSQGTFPETRAGA
jgi:AcrR family transcriptional regulator